MREINIATVILSNRKEKGITQDALADYIGVTKASVSKWETAQSYPDITLLPQLATYFNISIDELVGYMPQMTKADIQKTYKRLTQEFGTKPFDDVYETCQAIIKKYYACFPLLLQMALLYINHHMLAEGRPKQVVILKEAIELCERIKKESDDVWVVKQANSFEAIGYMMLGEPVMVLDRLEGTIKPMISDDATLALAYQMLGKHDEAKSVLQVSMYQHLLSLIGIAPTYFQTITGPIEDFEATLKRFLTIAQSFEVDALNQNVMAQLYYSAALAYTRYGDSDKALHMIEKYTQVCLSIKFPATLHGDAFFDSIDDWIKDFDLGNQAPRGEKVIKESMLFGLTQNPAFEGYKDDTRFKQCVYKLNT